MKRDLWWSRIHQLYSSHFESRPSKLSAGALQFSNTAKRLSHDMYYNGETRSKTVNFFLDFICRFYFLFLIGKSKD